MLRWLVPAVVPAILFAFLVYRSDKNREPPLVLGGTFLFAALLAGGAFFLEGAAMRFTGLDGSVSAAGNAGSLVFLFLFVAPMRETAKVIAVWPAFRSRHFDEAYDGVVYSSVAALGFAAIENAVMLRAHPLGWEWLLRALLALPAHVFFAGTWGYALGRAKRAKRPGPIFPMAWIAAVLAHGLYAHLVYGRGSGALVGTLPLLMAMGIISFMAMRDLKSREGRESRISVFGMSAPPSLGTVREALRRADQPLRFRWIFFGAFVTIGMTLACFVAAVALGHWLRIDFSVVDERDVTTTYPVLLLGGGLFLAFLLSGMLITRASGVRSLLEPALASALALVIALFGLGLTAPIALVFGLAFSPILWGLFCAGAWVARPAA